MVSEEKLKHYAINFLKSEIDKIHEALEVRCPFCEEMLEVYIWSFAGSGKRCSCGALLGMYGCVKEVEND